MGERADGIRPYEKVYGCVLGFGERANAVRPYGKA